MQGNVYDTRNYQDANNIEIPLKFDFGESHKLVNNEYCVVGGFVHNIRDHGGLLFIDLRSQTSLLQCVISPETSQEAFDIAEKLKNESVIKVYGKIRERTADTINSDLTTGNLEIAIEKIEVISTAKALPFDIHGLTNLANEDLRLKYRYLDLRREKLHNLMKLRHKFILALRNWFDQEGFTEVQTPILANSSPEGSRDYLVPSRIHPGKFYALPQAPQQFKQLLMVGGFTKYFQIAPCFRDEDPRSDRAVGDFYQLDLEMAWANQEDIFAMFEKLVREIIVKPEFTSKTLAQSDLQSDSNSHFTRLTYDEAMNKYGSDKPDLRYDLAWQNVKTIFENSKFKVFAELCESKESRVQALVIKNAVDKFSRSDLDKIQDIGRQNGLPGIAYIQYYEDGAKSPIFKFFGDESEQQAKQVEIKNLLEVATGDLVLFIANPDKNIVFKAQNQMRQFIAKHLGLIDENVLKFAWIYDFPFFERDEKSGKLDFCHNPFGAWKCDDGLSALETIQKYEKEDRLLELKAIQYDITCNGLELSSGGVRNNIPDNLLHAFELVGYSESEVKARFGHMLEAYQYGAPYHAGFAPGIDRMIMILTGESNIREVIPFPKNGSGIDPMTDSPSVVLPIQLKELGIRLAD